MKTWPPRHNSCCQRCALVKRLSEEKGSLFNSSSLTPCHCWAGTEPRAGRVVRAALYLVSYIPVLKIRRLRSPTSPLQGLIVTKTTVDLCMGLTVNPALSRMLIIRFFPTSLGLEVTSVPFLKMRELGIRNEMTGSRIIKITPGGASFRSLRLHICCLSPLHLVHPRSDTEWGALSFAWWLLPQLECRWRENLRLPLSCH